MLSRPGLSCPGNRLINIENSGVVQGLFHQVGKLPGLAAKGGVPAAYSPGGFGKFQRPGQVWYRGNGLGREEMLADGA